MQLFGDPRPPFTPAQVQAAGLTRARLRRLEERGEVRRLLRGVYVDAAAPDTATLRRQGLALVVPPGRIVQGRTAAWAHGLAAVPRPGESLVRRSGLGSWEVMEEDGLRLTRPLRTLHDVARSCPPAVALPLLDEALRVGLVPARELLTLTGRGSRVVALADGRAASAAASLLRLRWHDARLPTPVPGLEVGGVRLTLALPEDRFAVVLDQPAIAPPGWTVVRVGSAQVSGGAESLAAHLEREFRRHLLLNAG